MDSEVKSWSLVWAYKKGIVSWKNAPTAAVHIVNNTEGYTKMVSVLRRQLKLLLYVAIVEEDAAEGETEYV